jgi:DNA polymerase epsilon subunit 1
VGFFIVDGTNADDVGTGDAKKPLSGKAFVWLINGGVMSMDSRPPFQRIYRKFQPHEDGQVKFTVSFASSIEDALRKCGERVSAYVRERHGPTVAVVQGSANGMLGFDPRHWRKALPALQELPVCTMPPNSTDDMYPAVGWQMFAAERMVQRFLIFPRWMDDRLDCARYAHIPICNLGADALTTMIDVIFARILQHNRHLLWASETGMPDLGGAEVDHLGVWSDALAEPIINDPGVYRSVCVELDIFGLAVCAIMSAGLLDAEGLSAVSVARSNPGVGAFGKGFEEGAGAAASTSASISSDASVARAFNLLKAITTKWLDDVQQRGDPISDSIITALYRYLCGYGNALLRDPALHRVVYGLMVKLFRRIVSALKKLGTKVIYADFSRVIIHTDKYDLASAREYVDFIVAAFGSREMFANLSVTSKTFWEQLVWLGPDNWSGILLKEDAEVDTMHNLDEDLEGAGEGEENNEEANDGVRDNDEPENDDGDDGKNVGKSSRYDFLDHLLDGDKKKGRAGVNPGRDPADEYEDEYVDDEGEHLDYGETNYESGYYDEEEEEEGEVDAQKASATGGAVADPLLQSHWTISRYLPAAATEYFNFIVGEYMYLHRNRRRALEDSRTQRLELMHSNPTQAQQEDEEREPVPMEDEAIMEKTNDYMRQIIRHQLADRLLKLVDELATAFGTSAVGRSPGAVASSPEAALHPTVNNPALEFVKFTTHIMSLDPSLANDVASLKRLLLAQLKVREFSEDSQFRDPSLSYVLRDVICSYCSSCRDLDLLRDESVTHTEKARRWRCVHCGNAINTEEVENRLLDEAERLSTTYLLQDMRCPQTHAVSTRLCATTSVLCKKLAMDFPAQKLHEQYSVLMKVARFHEFSWLEKTLNELAGSAL